MLGWGPAVSGLDRAMSRRTHEHLHAPELIELETINGLRRLVRTGTVSTRRATEAVRDLDSLRLRLHAHGPLRDRVWELGDALSAYDASYLALAEALHGSVLLTADRGLAARARQSIGPERVRRVT
jgi:predicted nucleic acid-binding protein